MALRQIVDNLLANVRTHTPPGTRATVRLLADPEAPGTVVLEVADAGPGLDPEHVERVFERFYRADPSRSRGRGGTGLGLAVVAALAAAQGGGVEVVSPPGAGATFRVRLVAAPEPQPAASPDAPPPEPEPVVPVTRSSGP
jgi:two-component system OmpR family sensor kinase